MRKEDKGVLDFDYIDIITEIFNKGLSHERLESIYDLGYKRALNLKPIKPVKLKSNIEIDYLEKLIKANKVLYYNGLAITDDIEYDELETRLEKIDPSNQLVNYTGWDNKWLGNKGYRND